MKILRGVFYTLIFTLAFAYVVIFYMPLNYFKHQIEEALPPHLAIVGLQGSIAKGKIAQLSYQGISVEQLNWKFNPILLKFYVNIPANKDWNLSASWRFSGIKFYLEPGSVQAFNMPVVALDGEFDGNLTYKIDKNMQCKIAEGQIKTAKLAVLSPMQTDLKNIVLNLACSENNTLLNIISNDTRLNAKIALLLNKRYMDINAEGKLGEHDLTPLLETMVHPNAEGNFTFKRKLPLRF